MSSSLQFVGQSKKGENHPDGHACILLPVLADFGKCATVSQNRKTVDEPLKGSHKLHYLVIMRFWSFKKKRKTQNADGSHNCRVGHLNKQLKMI